MLADHPAPAAPSLKGYAGRIVRNLALSALRSENGGQGSFGAYGTESSRKVLVWNFLEPVDTDLIQGVYVGEAYHPVK